MVVHERERETERDRERQTDRQTDRQRQTDRDRRRQTETERRLGDVFKHVGADYDLFVGPYVSGRSFLCLS